MKRVAVIGCGAAGMMAAFAAATGGAETFIFEKNEKPGKKLYITGKGRCNLTNDCETEDFFSHVVHGQKFLYSSIYGFSKDAVKEFFTENGCPVKVERGRRVFPCSDHSSDVIQALVRGMERGGVRMRFHTQVQKLLFSEDGQKVLGIRLAGGEELAFDAVIVATGGLSYASTGSTGDGYKFARSAGHEVTACVPSLTPLIVREEWCKDLQGLSLKNVFLKAVDSDEKILFEDLGEMLFTHYGVSGPLILSASAYWDPSKKMQLLLDLKPGLTDEQLDARILREFESAKNKQFMNVNQHLFPSKLIPVMVKRSGIAPEKRVHEITREERKHFVYLMKNLRLTVTGCRGFSEAVVTRGGVSLKEINPSTMESKRVGGLYFAGEVVDLDALTGGYNLQIAWSTGHLAGESAAD